MNKVVLTLVFSIVFVGCGAKTGMSPTVSYSGFDESQTVTISQHSNDCGPFDMCTSMGAQWREATPNKALLIVQMNGELMNVDSVEFNIDGEKFTLNNDSITDHSVSYQLGYKSSKSNFVVDLDFIRKITKANRVWLRFNGYSKYVENRVVDGDKEGWAFNALKRFLTKIDEIQNLPVS